MIAVIVTYYSLQESIQCLPYISWPVASYDKQSNNGFQGRHTAFGFVVTFLFSWKLVIINGLFL
jgi:hypothetical protein